MTVGLADIVGAGEGSGASTPAGLRVWELVMSVVPGCGEVTA